MTDDRARRIRDIRNRSTGESDGTDESAADAESESDVEAETGTETDAAADGAGSDEAEATAESEPNETTEADAASTDASESESGDASETDASSAGTDEGDEPDSTDEREREQEQGQDRGETAQPTGETANPDDADGETLSYDETETAGGEEPLEQAAAERTEVEPAADAGGTAIANRNAATTTGIGAGTGTGAETTNGVSEASLQGAIAGMSDTATVDERVGEATVDSTAIMDADTYGEAAGREEVFDRGDSLIASAHNEEDTVQMLEFYLNDNRYAIEIGRVSAIVEMKDITRFPRGPEAIDGVTDLRGEITGVLDPTVMLDIERNDPSEDHYIVVLERDGDKQKLGIRVTDVSQAVTYRESQIDETGSVMDGADAQHEFVEGIIKKNIDDGTALVAWLDIDSLIETTETEYTPSDYVRN